MEILRNAFGYSFNGYDLAPLRKVIFLFYLISILCNSLSGDCHALAYQIYNG